MSFIAIPLYAPRYCLAASAGFGPQFQELQASVSLRSTLFAALAVCDSHFRRFVLFQTASNEYRSTSFKGRAAQQTEHREAMTKQDGKRQIKLA